MNEQINKLDEILKTIRDEQVTMSVEDYDDAYETLYNMSLYIRDALYTLGESKAENDDAYLNRQEWKYVFKSVFM